jgi:hypothetical protein
MPSKYNNESEKNGPKSSSRHVVPSGTVWLYSTMSPALTEEEEEMLSCYRDSISTNHSYSYSLSLSVP